MKKSVILSVAAVALSVSVSGCAYNINAKKAADEHFSKTREKAAQNLNSANESPYQLNDSGIKKISGKWIGRKSIPISNDVILPKDFYERWTFTYPAQRVNIATVAERITKSTGIPVLVRPDAYIPIGRFVMGGAPMTTTSVSGAAATIPGVAGATGIPGAINTTMPGMTTTTPGQIPSLQSGSPMLQVPGSTQMSSTAIGNVVEDMSTNVDLSYDGTLYDYLNFISARASVNWEYKDGRIEFYRLATKTMTVKALSGEFNFNGSVGKTGSTSGGSGESTSSFSSDSNIQIRSISTLWISIEQTIRSMLSPVGRVVVNQATGTISVTDSKDIVDTVSSYLEKENANLSRQVRVKVEVVNVQLSNEYQQGVNWNLVYSRVGDLIQNLRFNMPPILNASPNAGNVSFSVPAEAGKLAGSNAVIQILNTLGQTSITNTTNALTFNRQPVPVAITDQVSYIASTTAAASNLGGTGGTPGLTPGTVTTGFILNMLPTIQDNGSVMMQFSLDISELKRLNDVTSGTQRIQTPEVSSTQFLQRFNIRRGETLVLAGFERETNQYDKRGIDQATKGPLTGSISGKGKKEALVVMITPMIEDN